MTYADLAYNTVTFCDPAKMAVQNQYLSRTMLAREELSEELLKS